MTDGSGGRYDGLWLAGEREGYGEFVSPNGHSYKGEWHLGKERGRGVKVYSDGSIYKGQFSEGKRSGQGEFNYAFGTLKTYTGYWINDKREGHGILLQRDGATYVGEFRDDAINGEGTAIYPDGSKYIGQFVNGERHGYGTHIWSNGVKYQGQWVDGKESGGGVYYDAKGNVMRTNRAGSVQLVNEQGVFKVPVTINDSVKLSFIVDSGAADVSIPVDVVLVMFRSGTLASTDFIGSQTYVMADGSKVPSARFIIRNLKVGDYTIQNVVGSVANVQGDLLLGQSFLQKFKRWSFNNVDHTLDLEQ